MNANRPCILVLASTYPRWVGDTEPPFVHELCRRLANDFRIVVLAPHAPSAKTFEEWDEVTVIRFRYFIERWQTLAYNGGILSNLRKNRLNYLLVPFFLCAQLFAIIRAVKIFPVSGIHAHWLFPQGFLGLLGARIAGKASIPVICTSHGGDLFGLQGKLFNQIKHWVICHASALTVVSHAMREYILQTQDLLIDSKTHVISMGADLTTRFTPPPAIQPRNSFELLFVGRLVEKKGLKYLIEAMPHVLRQHPQTHLKIVGAGPELKYLTRLIAELKLEQHVSFLGAVHNDKLPELYRKATLFVAPFVECKNGDQEGLGLVIVEAMGCCCPVLASDMPAVRDVIIDGQTGLLTRQACPQSIAARIIQFVDSPSLQHSLSVNGRAYVLSRFDWEIVTQKYSQVISSLCQ